MIDDLISTRSRISPSTKIITHDTRIIRPPRLSRTFPADLRIKVSRSRSGSHSGNQIAQPTSHDHGRARSTDRGSEREGRLAEPVQTFGRDLRI
jgi:hypothetical protein